MGRRKAAETRKEETRKAPNGTGSTFQRKRGDRLRWFAEIMIGHHPDGRPKKRTSPGFDTEAEADLWLSKVKVDRAAGTLLDPSKSTVAEYLNHWLTTVAIHNIKATTYNTYDGIIRLYLVSGIGHHKLTKLQPHHVQQLYHEVKTDKKLSAQTVRHIHMVLHRALEHARRQGTLAVNVTDQVERPKVNRAQMPCLTFAEALRLLQAAEGDRLHALWVIALTLGLRQGELLGLRWADVDLEAGTLRVAQTVSEINGKIIFNTPKSQTSRRVFDMPPMVITALKRWRSVQTREKMENRDIWQEHDLVFTAERVGTPISANNLRKRSFPRLMSRAGLVDRETVKQGRRTITTEKPKCRFHDLRHTAATMMREMGMEPEEVQRMLGHADVTTTLRIYSHLWETRKKAVAQKLQDFWTNGSTKAR